jgi:hypothetical protein
MYRQSIGAAAVCNSGFQHGLRGGCGEQMTVEEREVVAEEVGAI